MGRTGHRAVVRAVAAPTRDATVAGAKGYSTCIVAVKQEEQSAPLVVQRGADGSLRISWSGCSNLARWQASFLGASHLSPSDMNSVAPFVNDPGDAVDWPFMAEQRPDVAQCIAIAPTALSGKAHVEFRSISLLADRRERVARTILASGQRNIAG